METHRLVLPEDMNHFGFLFGGRLLSWVDEASWIAATLDFPEARFVTVGLDEVTFRHRVGQGSILSIQSTLASQGMTSACYEVVVRLGRTTDGAAIFSTKVTFVNVDEKGQKKAIGARKDRS